MAKKTDPALAPLELLAGLDREALEEQLASAEAELEAAIAAQQQKINALKVLLKAARIRDGVEVRKKPVRKTKGSTKTVAAASDGDQETGGGQAVADMRGVAQRIRAAIVHGGPQTVEGLIASTGFDQATVETFLARSQIVRRLNSGKYALAS